MPRVALNAEQRRKNAASDLYKEILDHLNMVQGKGRKTDIDFAAELGISRGTWYRWNHGMLGRAEFGVVLDAAMRAGLTITVAGVAPGRGLTA